MHNTEEEIKILQDMIEVVIDDGQDFVIVDGIFVSKNLNNGRNKTFLFWIRMPVEALLKVINNQEQIMERKRQRQLLFQMSKSVVSMLHQVEYEVIQEYIKDFFQEDRGINPGNIVSNLIKLLDKLAFQIQDVNTLQDSCKEKLRRLILIKVTELRIIKNDLNLNQDNF